MLKKFVFLDLSCVHNDIHRLFLSTIATARLNNISIYYISTACHFGCSCIEIDPRISARRIVANINAHIRDDIVAKCYSLGMSCVVYSSTPVYIGQSGR